MNNLQIFKPIGGGNKNFHPNSNLPRPPLRRPEKTLQFPSIPLRRPGTPSPCPPLSLWSHASAVVRGVPLEPDYNLRFTLGRSVDGGKTQHSYGQKTHRGNSRLSPLQRPLRQLVLLLALLSACSKQPVQSASPAHHTIESFDSAGNINNGDWM